MSSPELLQNPEQSEPTVALNPLTGIQLKDLADVAARTLTQGARQPLILAKHLSSHLTKLVDIVSGAQQYLPQPGDKRFSDESWREHGVYRRLAQSYLATNESMEEWVSDLDLDQVDQLRAQFLLRVIGDSMSPVNSVVSNPAAFRKARQTRGKSVVRGLQNLVEDLRHNHGIPAQVNRDAFAVGENLATSPGAVVFRNEVLELIQYAPATAQVHRRPVVMVSAMINKFYALDLTPDRSLVKYCVDNGLQVFVVSWANPTQQQSHWGVEEYALAVIEALGAVKSITGCKNINLFALCSGAMMASAMAAYLEAVGDKSIHSMTIGVCMLDMQNTDMELSAFSSPDTFERIKKRSQKAGILRGHELALSMLLLRPQDLIWSNVVNNYLLGNAPPEFDLLYWNNDWTNLPAALHADVIDMFSEASLSTAGEFKIEDQGLDLKAVSCDKFIIGALTDHITPWKACYRSAHLQGGDKEFVLSNSGHIQTLLNSPAKKRASFFVNRELPLEPDTWLDEAQVQQGSWWPYWLEWLQARSLSKKKAPVRLGNKHFPAGDPAPGTYVYQSS